MKSHVVLLSIIAQATATFKHNLAVKKLLNHNDNAYIDWGALTAQIDVGHLPPKYETPSVEDQTASYNAFQLADIVRPLFRTGIESMPPLDPYHKKSVAQYTVMSLLHLVRVHIRLKNLVMTGVQQFKLQNVEVRLGDLNNYRIDLNLVVPVLKVEAEFEIDLFAILKIPSVKGKVRLMLEKLNVTAAVGGKPVAHQVHRKHHEQEDVDTNDNHYLYEDALQASGQVSHFKFQLVVNNPILNAITKVALKLLSSVIHVLYKLFQPLLNKLVFNIFGSKVILPQINQILDSISLEQALAWLLRRSLRAEPVQYDDYTY